MKSENGSFQGLSGAWVLFLLFVASNAALSYGHLLLASKLWIILGGILLPLGLAAFLKAESFPAGGGKPGLPFGFKPWIWILGGALAVGVRLYRLVSLPVWPMWDDAYSAYDALNQMQHWSFQMVYSQEKIPFPFYWLLALWFKIFQPSLVSLWLFPAVLSILILPLGYWACRQYFPSSFSLIFLGILAFSFWPVYLGRFCLGTGLWLVWELTALGFLGRFLHSLHQAPSRLAALALGFCLGLGFYTSVMAFPAIGWMTFLALGLLWSGKNRFPALFLSILLLAPLGLLAAPLAPLWMDSLQAGHLHDYMAYGHRVPWDRQLSTSLSYFTVFLWGSLNHSYFDFGPLWGGFLNPILGSAFLVGGVHLYQGTPCLSGVEAPPFTGFPKRALFWASLAFFLAYLVPSALTNTAEFMRLVELLPFCLFVTAWGTQELLRRCPGRWKGAVLALFGLASFSLDAHHLLGPYHQWAIPGLHSQDSKSAKRYRAFQILNQVQAQEGPGIVLTEFIPDIFDQSLGVAAYPFNAARNPTLDPNKARWAGVLLDDSFRPYLSRCFPRSQSYPLSGGLPNLEGNLTLYLLPLDGSSGPVVQKWLEAHRQIQGLFGLMPYHSDHPDEGPAIRWLKPKAPYFQGDSFLESCFWEKLADLEDKDSRYGQDAIQCLEREIRICGSIPELRWREGYFWERLGEDDQDFRRDDRRAVQAFHLALQTGYESPKLYKQLLLSEARLRNFSQALWAAQQAGRLTPEDPAPPELVQWLQTQAASTGGRPTPGPKP